MRLRLPALFALLVVATACIEGVDLPSGRYGTASVPAIDLGGVYALRPEVAFYDRTEIGYLPFSSDTCLVAFYQQTVTLPPGLLTLDAGDELFTAVSGRTDTLVPVPGLNIRVYTPVRANGIPFVPGDTLTLTVPGATRGFPASAVSVRTAEPFTHSAIGVPLVDEGIPVTWDPAPAPGSQMTFSLRYATPTSTIGLNEQVFCSFDDDGSALIPPQLLDGWRNAFNNQRETRATRVRWREVQVDARTRLSILSQFTVPTPTLTTDPATLAAALRVP